MPSSTINYTTTEPDGTVGAKFTGQIEAKGLQLDAVSQQVTVPENPNRPPEPNRIEWRDILGLLYGRIDSVKIGNDSQLTITNQRNDALSYARLLLATTGDVNAGPSSVNVWAKGIGKSVVQRELLDSDGQSDFAQRAQFIRLPLVTANTTRGGAQQICGWTWQPTIPGPYLLCVTGSGYVSVAGVAYYQPYVNNVPTAGGNLYFNQTSVHQCLIPQFGIFTVPNPPTLQTILVLAGALNTDPNFDWYNGFIAPLP